MFTYEDAQGWQASAHIDAVLYGKKLTRYYEAARWRPTQINLRNLKDLVGVSYSNMLRLADRMRDMGDIAEATINTVNLLHDKSI
jgi:hypothetical protein